jgi:large subunit ribosomal protein L25
VDYTLTHLGDNALYDISVGSDTSTARVVDVHRDPVSGRLVHVDFIPVNMTQRIEVTVPLTVEGEAPGVEQDGGVLQQVAYELQVESLPGNIPQEITVNVSNLQMGDNLALGDITLPEGVSLISEPEGIAVTVVAPTEITEEEIEAAGIVEEEGEEAASQDVEEGEEDAAEQSSEEENE